MSLNNFYNHQTKTTTFAAVILGVSALLSRVLGLLRDRLLAGKFGAGEELDIYFAAFRIPDFIYGILITGGIAAVFLPVFSEYFSKNKEEVWKFVSNVLNCFLALIVLLCGLLLIFAPQVINLIAPGFSGHNKETAVLLTRIMFLSPILFGLSNIFSGILQYFNRFLAYSLAPIFYNVGIITGIVFFVPIFGLKGLAYGVILGAALHLIIQIPAAKHAGFKYFPTLNFRYPGLIKVFKLMVPRTIGTAVYQVNLMVITALASFLTPGAITVFSFSDNLQYFPIGLVGLSFAVASFPSLSRSWANGAKEEFLKEFSFTFRQIAFLTIPISLLMFFLRAQIIRVVLGTGNFGWLETRLTSACLGLFCFGILFSALIPFLARVFYSFQDTKTPVIIGLASMVFNISLCFVFVSFLRYPNLFQEFITHFLKLQGIKDISVTAFPLAVSFSAAFQFLLLFIFLKKKAGDIKLKEIVVSLKKIIAASLLMSFFVYFILYLSAGFLNTQTFAGILLQGLFGGLAGIFSYILFSKLFKVTELNAIKHSILKQFTPTP